MDLSPLTPDETKARVAKLADDFALLEEQVHVLSLRMRYSKHLSSLHHLVRQAGQTLQKLQAQVARLK